MSSRYICGDTLLGAAFLFDHESSSAHLTSFPPHSLAVSPGPSFSSSLVTSGETVSRALQKWRHLTCLPLPTNPVSFQRGKLDGFGLICAWKNPLASYLLVCSLDFYEQFVWFPSIFWELMLTELSTLFFSAAFEIGCLFDHFQFSRPILHENFLRAITNNSATESPYLSA